jgi:hypothetical protein
MSRPYGTLLAAIASPPFETVGYNLPSLTGLAERTSVIRRLATEVAFSCGGANARILRSADSHRRSNLCVSGGRGRRDHGPGHGHRGRGRHVRDTGRGPCPGLDPNGGHAQNGRDPHPKTLQSTVRRHDEAQPNGRPHTVAVSSNPRAICSAFLQDTNSPRSKRIPDPVSAEERELREEPEAVRY